MSEQKPKPLPSDPDTSLSTRAMHRYETQEREGQQKKSSVVLSLVLFVLAVGGIVALLLWGR